MNYYGPQQRKADGRWDFTRLNDKEIWPVGYCRAYREWSDEDVKRFGIPKTDHSIVQAAEFKEKHHTDGHATEADACECYKQYLLDQRLQLRNGENGDSQHKCRVCGAWTSLYAMVDGHWMATLCESHNTREEVAKLYEASSMIMTC